MRSPGLFLWKEAPFFRLFFPFCAGIVTQYYCSIPNSLYWALPTACIIGLVAFSRLPATNRFRLRTAAGMILHILLFMAGALLTHYRVAGHRPLWMEEHYQQGDAIVVAIEEPLTEKAQTYRTVAAVKAIVNNQKVYPVNGKLLLYFEKDSSLSALPYGQQLMFCQTPEPVKNTGNPGAFDYRQYCAANGIFYQVYVKKGAWLPAGFIPVSPVKRILFHTRKKVLDIIRENINGKKQAGLAEALLIGYKDELDKELLQSYTDTGVVHIIAVSGLHLGLIYGVLLLLCQLLCGKGAKWIRPVLIIAVLWLFAFLAGGTPSVLRSAIMFSCLAIGNQLRGKTPAYNSLAASAFLLLCYDPLWWRDVGFQLSYAAVLSIMLFVKPVYNSLSVSNKYLDVIWKPVAVTIAAQLLTTPISLYYFHQFPNLFLLTNLLAIPLSGIILIGELLLCAVAWLPVAAKATGWLLYWLIRCLNGFIEAVQQIPFNNTGGILLTPFQLLLLYAGIGSITAWLLLKKKAGLYAALTAGWLLTVTVVYARWQTARQEKIIVYNIPKYQAIDFVEGAQYVSITDSLLLNNYQQQRFYLTPSRILNQASPVQHLPTLQQSLPLFSLGHHSLLLIDKSVHFRKLPVKLTIDYIVLSHNTPVSIQELAGVFSVSSIIVDASNSRWKTRSWKQDCALLGIPCHTVADQGAFVFSLH